MTNILKRGINSNVLKTIAVIAMVIDHIGYYFSPVLSTPVYIIYRYIGRIAMPIFVYLLVQGFFHTKNFKKYIIRLSVLAIITQMTITLLMFVNIKFIPEYTAAKELWTIGNILFPFVISMIILKVLYEDIIIKKWDYSKNLSLRIIIIILLILLSILVPTDYGVQVVVLSMLLYYIEKFKIYVYLQKNSYNLTIIKAISIMINEEIIKVIYILLIVVALFTLVICFDLHWPTIFAIIPIALYNNERGKTNMKYVYYITFPLQHVLLYLVAMLTLT